MSKRSVNRILCKYKYQVVLVTNASFVRLVTVEEVAFKDLTTNVLDLFARIKMLDMAWKSMFGVAFQDTVSVFLRR